MCLEQGLTHRKHSTSVNRDYYYGCDVISNLALELKFDLIHRSVLPLRSCVILAESLSLSELSEVPPYL